MNTFNLDSLLANATVTSEILVPKEVTWKNEAGEEAKYTVYIVDEISYAASDRIHFEDKKYPDSSKNARVIHERVRFSEDGTQRLNPTQIDGLKSELIWALIFAISDHEKSKKPKAAEGQEEGQEEAKE